MEESKFKIGDRVCLADEKQKGNPWYVIGVVMRPCYNVIAWEIYLGRATYGDYPMSAFGARCDTDTLGPLREEQVVTEHEWLEKQKAKLADEIADAERRLAELKSRA
jgi:hypothetical protein